jgi:AcrR family transcriptional regulator
MQVGDAPAARGSAHARILESARRLFAEHGYESTTTAAIARGAGTSESQIIKHFGGKEGLLEAIFEAAWEAMAEPLRRELAEAPAGAKAKLGALGGFFLSRMEADPELAVLMLFEGRRIRRRSGGVRLTPGFRRLVATIDGLLRAHGDATLRPGVHPEAARAALIGAWEGLLRDRLLAGGGGVPASYDREAMRSLLDRLLEALFGPSAEPTPDRVS